MSYKQINAVKYSQGIHSTYPATVIGAGQEVTLRFIKDSAEEGICV